jgi:hypothetical protein
MLRVPIRVAVMQKSSDREEEVEAKAEELKSRTSHVVLHDWPTRRIRQCKLSFVQEVKRSWERKKAISGECNGTCSTEVANSVLIHIITGRK